MGTGKTRCALVAALQLYRERKIDRVLVLAPAAVRLSWRQEIDKFQPEEILPCVYETKTGKIFGAGKREGSPLPVLIISYGLLPQKRHVEALHKWCASDKTLLVADESSFLKSRTAKQTKGSAIIAQSCVYRWLLTGTPIANSPLDLYGQALVMSGANGGGPLKQFKSWWQFRARYAVLKQMNMGSIKFQQVVAYQNIDELTKRFASYVLRRTKDQCLDLPEKTYTTREIALTPETWRIYQELRKEAMLCLPDSEERPEPNAATRILRLCQLTSGHVGGYSAETDDLMDHVSRDVSSEKLDWLVEEILSGELANERAIVCWTRWRRERERLAKLLPLGDVYQIYGGQSQKERDFAVETFQKNDGYKRVLLAQPHAGGFGLNLTAASTAVYLSNDFSYTTRVQSEDRIHRIGQHSPCLYVDVLATSPSGGKTVDHVIIEALKAKKSLAEM